MTELNTQCIRNNGVPNHFDHGAKKLYNLDIVILHYLQNLNHIDVAWPIILPWIDKVYFEGKIGYDLYETYDKYLLEHTGYQYFGFESDAPVRDLESFELRQKKYSF